MKCRCCQNWQISQISAVDYAFKKEIEPEEVVRLALSYKDNIGIAYTYNEPTIWFEYMLAIARLVKSHGMKNVMVSNGFIGEEPLQELLRCLDAFNIDLKGFTDDFYITFTGATLDPILRTLQQIRKTGKHLEITNLVIPSVNDDPVRFKEMIKWIADKLGVNTVLHLSRYHPDYKLTNETTPAAQLEKLYEIAREKLSYVYVGNILLSRFQDTHCSNCGELMISRHGYQVSLGSLTDRGSCGNCGHQVIYF
jgi:pyruvate formate lyase activating enzyme